MQLLAATHLLRSYVNYSIKSSASVSLLKQVLWIRCSTSFSLLRSAVTCLREARSHRGSPVTIGALDLAIAEGQVVPSH